MAIRRNTHNGTSDPLWRRWELPTWGVAASIYGGFALLTWHHQVLPWWLLAPLGAWFVAWHASLQHEAIHGHPSRSARLNALVAGLPLGLWLPYGIYREWHFAHHEAEVLTAPAHDPESFYVSEAAWARAGPLRRRLLVWHNTLAGRLVLGPPWLLAGFYRDELSRLARGDLSHLAAWAWHALAVAPVVGWLLWVGLPLWFYLLAMVWPGVSLTLMRSFHEHRTAPTQEGASLTLHAGAPWALLYLNNNLHAAHHARPALAWYELPRFQRQLGSAYEMPGYGALLRRYLFKPRAAPVYPG